MAETMAHEPTSIVEGSLQDTYSSTGSTVATTGQDLLTRSHLYVWQYGLQDLKGP